MRRQGFSVKAISRELGVSKSSISIWVRDIELTPEQLRQLNQNSELGREKGRTVTSLMYKRRRQEIHKNSVTEARALLGACSDRDLLLSGIALYWAEGNKKTHKVRFTNSDPAMILLMINWLKKYFGVLPDEIGAFLGIHEMHKGREQEVISYWSDLTGIPKNHFQKTIFKRSKSRKVYENMNSHFGTVTIFVWKATKIYYRILGLIEVLATKANVAQR
jgi:hypothetical protein